MAWQSLFSNINFDIQRKWTGEISKMSKTAFVFPGQGAQYVGMGKDFYEAFPESREVFETASGASGLDIAKLCFEENEQINQTEYTQICMLAAEMAVLRAWREKAYAIL